MNHGLLIDERDNLRKKWHKIREERMKLKNRLVSDGIGIQVIRHDTEYKLLKKEQRKLSKMIKHTEYKISRAADK